jgi:hypothetical protein
VITPTPDKIAFFESEVPHAATVAAMQEARQGELLSLDSISAPIADLNFQP